MRPIPSFLVLLALSVAPTAEGGTLVATPNASAFGSVSVNTGAATRSISIASSGGSTQITGFSFGSGCAEFGVTPPSALPVQVPNNSSLTFTLAYDPIDRNSDACTITPTTGIPSGTGGSFSATGDGLAPELTSLTSTLIFADQPWNGGTPQTLDVVIQNNGEEPISASNLSAVLTTGTQFSVGPAVGLPFNVGETATIPITFDPISQGAMTDTLTLSLNNDSPTASNLTIPLSGTGTGGAPPPVPLSTDAGRRLLIVALVFVGTLALSAKGWRALRPGGRF